MNVECINKGLDQHGYIANTCSVEHIQTEFKGVLGAVIKTLLAEFTGEIHSIYLYGSIARGTAVKNRSDMDISVVFLRPLTDENKRKLAVISARIPEQYSIITKLDLDPGHKMEVLQPQEKYRWQFWLKHCCCCIWGDDLSKEFTLLKPNIKIAFALNSDLESWVNSIHCDAFESTSDQRGKIIAKKILRTAYYLIAEQDRSWYVDLNQCGEVAIRYYPESVEHIHQALALCQSDEASLAQGMALYQAFGQKLALIMKNAN
ncbi:nucleotidyltransferase domain-containing protein [Vibrio tapetis]|uniref:Putative Nucleotidyltransferase n=1 Tax=Vibrio tapetis subsp. tapetis TaxID=1671868 RepID=A0A2N8ZL25_9VIBR|nr:nucleotidyltransferase domain-containing protein [Vibrio tapetis]SON52587.1 putative Nucleotidyltransferase [Vibrio tapetis subsp. tapetis]